MRKIKMIMMEKTKKKISTNNLKDRDNTRMTTIINRSLMRGMKSKSKEKTRSKTKRTWMMKKDRTKWTTWTNNNKIWMNKMMKLTMRKKLMRMTPVINSWLNSSNTWAWEACRTSMTTKMKLVRKWRTWKTMRITSIMVMRMLKT